MSAQLMPKPKPQEEQSSSLTHFVEDKFITLIDQDEAVAYESRSALRAANYIRLANLYNFQKNYQKELTVLKRFVNSPLSDGGDLIGMHERIDFLVKQKMVQDNINAQEGSEDNLLSLVALESEIEKIEIGLTSSAVRNKTRTRAIKGKPMKLLIVSAVCTGRSVKDEVIQLSMQLLEYRSEAKQPFKVLETYTGARESIRKIPSGFHRRHHVKLDAHEKRPLNRKKVLELFRQADYVVSHDNSDIERKLVTILLPQIKNVNWYSSQKDIPWRALGFFSADLSTIAADLGVVNTKNSLAKVKAIAHILKSNEGGTDVPYIERIYHMKPMRKLEWSKEMSAQSKFLNRDSFGMWVAFAVVSVVGLGLFTKYPELLSFV